MIDISEMISDPDFAQDIKVKRTTGAWDKGRFVTGTPVDLIIPGIVTVCNVKDLQFVPEGDRVVGMMCFHTVDPIYVTRSTESETGISDLVTWNGDQYKIVQTLPETDYGFMKSFGARIVGK